MVWHDSFLTNQCCLLLAVQLSSRCFQTRTEQPINAFCDTLGLRKPSRTCCSCNWARARLSGSCWDICSCCTPRARSTSHADVRQDHASSVAGSGIQRQVCCSRCCVAGASSFPELAFSCCFPPQPPGSDIGTPLGAVGWELLGVSCSPAEQFSPLVTDVNAGVKAFGLCPC